MKTQICQGIHNRIVIRTLFCGEKILKNSGSPSTGDCQNKPCYCHHRNIEHHVVIKARRRKVYITQPHYGKQANNDEFISLKVCTKTYIPISLLT